MEQSCTREGGGVDEEEKGFTCAGVSQKRKGDDLVGGSSEDVFKNIEIPKDFADKIWEYGISLDGEDAIQCNCDDVITGGLYRFLYHLAGTEHGGEGYGGGGDEEEEKGCTCVGVGEKRKGEEVGGDGSSEDVFIFKKSRDGSKDKRMEILKEEADQAIASFFYNNGIPLKVVESESFIAMIDMISRYGVGFEPPSVEDLRGKYLTENVRLTNESLEEHRSVWKKTGCSIMVDGWTDKKKRSILNLLVNSLKGTFFLKSVDASDMLESPEKLFKMMDDIVEEVGEDNVVQIVTDVTPYYKAAGKMLMEKRTRLYWTPCATHCIEMMLNDYEKIPIYEEIITKGKKITTFIYSRSSLITLLHKFTKGVGLVRQGITRCVTSYLTLGRLYEKNEALRKMFTSKEWTSSQFAKTSVGKYAEDVVLDKVFWENVMICLNGANPLVDVLRLVNSIDEPATGFIYKAKEQAKEEIQRNLSKGGIESFVPLWEIIDERWDKQLHSPLHAAGYFLNPQIHYRPGFRDDIKVKDGLHHCIARMVADPEERAKIETQLDVFDKQANILGHPLAVMTVGDEIPSNWWSTFGDGLPELQKFACRVLSLTCSSYGDLRNQRAFKMVHAKKRNLLRQKTHNDDVFVMANIKLAEKKQAGGSVELNLDGNGDNEDEDEDEHEDGDDDLVSVRCDF
ncbi:hypothetical protein TSUD_285020 [Trifolium subterraneum]|uniref:DUF659 domain-containing protein n=1 Tax=Trifolium subterraneum TaxID=3900 RepID=A0A2Z6NZX3_TRISU|nr:hypothetical protein TSUD_285020 [Trifolium subterraneum]